MCCLFIKDKKREEERKNSSSPKRAYSLSQKSLKKINRSVCCEENNENQQLNLVRKI